nr:MAG TPA: hypothetical protein [Caudoviricetes sp.]
MLLKSRQTKRHRLLTCIRCRNQVRRSKTK